MSHTPERGVRLRLAPSPTGHFHLGTARTALFNWIFAKQQHGVFVLRIEDTDQERSAPEYEAEIMQGLSWLGIMWDEGPLPDGGERGAFGPYRQSQRGGIYKKYLEQLLEEGKAYYCYCSKEDLEAERQSFLTQGLPPKYSGHCRNLAAVPPGKTATSIRFKTPESQVEFKDMIRGSISFDAGLYGDMIIAKSAEKPLYNIAVVIDDHEMHITHVVRGEDHLSNTPKQILFQRALGFAPPEYAHLPLILAPDRSKLSKRYAETSLLEYREAGYLPSATVNFMALLGWHPSDDTEVLDTAEIVERFNIKKVQKGGAVFNQEKLDWLNAQHMKKMDEEALLSALEALFPQETHFFEDKAFTKKILSLERDRMKVLRDFPEVAGFFFRLPEYAASLLAWKETPLEKTHGILLAAQQVLGELPATHFDRQHIEDALRIIISGEGKGTVLWPLRVALSGRSASPDPFDIFMALGKEESMKRIAIALQKIRSDR